MHDTALPRLRANKAAQGGPVRLGEVHPTLREGLATFEVFRKLGFTADEVYVMVNLAGGPRELTETDSPWLGVQLQAQGLEFLVSIGELAEGTTAASFDRDWAAACEALLEDTQEARDELWQTSWIYAHRRGLVAKMVLRGFHFARTGGAGRGAAPAGAS